MVMITIHIAYITCLVTKDAWHGYSVIVVYKIHHGAGQISYFIGSGNTMVAGTPMGEVAAGEFNGASNTVVG